jgi:hypothetical protein
MVCVRSVVERCAKVYLDNRGRGSHALANVPLVDILMAKEKADVEAHANASSNANSTSGAGTGGGTSSGGSATPSGSKKRDKGGKTRK